MGQVLSVFVIGLSFGLILFLLAAGLTLTMGLMRVINLAHGALYMVGGYVGLSVAQHVGNFWVGVLAGAAIGGGIGFLLETVFLRRLYGQPTSQVLLTIGFIYIIQNVTQWIWGTFPSAEMVPKVFSGAWPIGSVNIPVFRLVIIGIGLVMAVLLWLLQEKTRIGAVVRAGMDNREIAGGLGINLKGVFTGVFVLGALVAGGCGLIGATATGINLGVAWDALLLSMIVVVVGGTGSIQGALAGGIVIGLINAFGTAYFPDFANFLKYAALIVVLLIRPQGLLGRPMVSGPTGVQYLESPSARKGKWAKAIDAWVRGAIAALIKPPTAGGGAASGNSAASSDGKAGAQAAAPAWRRAAHKWLPASLVLLALIVIPPFLGNYHQSIVTKVVIFAMFAMSLDLTMGYTGLVSFGHAAFLGVGGYTVGIFTQKLGIDSFWLILICALAAAAFFAAIIGYISLRVSGVYYLLVTMGLGQVLSIIAIKWTAVTQGLDGLMGISKPDLGWEFRWKNIYYYYMVLAVFLICYVILRRIVRSSFGRTLVGVRLNEPRMRSLGFNTWRLKYVGVIIGALFAAIAGIFFAYRNNGISPQDLALQTSSLPMLMVIIGGRGTLWGPAVGAAVIIFAQEYTSIAAKERWPLILGLIFVVCVMFIRGGFAHYLTRAWNKWGFVRVRPGRGTGLPAPEAAVADGRIVAGEEGE